MRFLILLGIILYFSFSFSVIFNIKPGRSLPAGFVVVFFAAYIPLLLENLSLFKITFVVLAIIFGIAVLLKKQLNPRSLLIDFKNYFNISVIVFIILFIYFFVVLSNVKLSNTDDLGFWGTFVKDILRNGALVKKYPDQYFLYSYRTYVPFAYVLNAGIQLICKGYYHEPTLIFGFSMFSLSLFMFLFDKFKYEKKNLPRIVFTIIAILLLTLTIQNNELFMSEAYIYNSIYVDWILGIALGLGFYEIINFDYNSNDSYFSLAIYLLIELTVKSVGQCLFLLLLFTFVVSTLVNKKINKSFFISLFCVILIPLTVYLSYYRYHQDIEGISMFDTIQDSTMISSIVGANKEGTSEDNIQESIVIDDSSQSAEGDSFVDNAEEAVDVVNKNNAIVENGNLTTIKNFINQTIFMPLYRHPFGLSYLSINTIVLLSFIIINYIKKEKNYLVPIINYLGSFAYALGILLSYLIIFNAEGATLSMFGRYMQTYTFAGLIFLFLYLGDRLNKNGLIPMLIVLALFTEPDSLKTIVYDKDRVNYKEKEISYFENFLNNEYDGQKMIVINQTMIEYAQLIRNVSAENNPNFTYVMCDKALISIDEFNSLISENDLLFIGDFDDRFNQYWNAVTDEACYNNTMYIINHSEDGTNDIRIMYCWEWEISLND